MDAKKSKEMKKKQKDNLLKSSSIEIRDQFKNLNLDI